MTTDKIPRALGSCECHNIAAWAGTCQLCAIGEHGGVRFKAATPVEGGSAQPAPLSDESPGVALLLGSSHGMGIPSLAHRCYLTDFSQTGFCIETQGENRALC